MSQLIISVLAILLTALTLLASVNYLPHWYRAADDTDAAVRSSLKVLERSYKAYAKVNGGVGPTVLAESDGGFGTQFRPLVKLIPPAPAGYSWSYGQHPSDGSIWAGLHYFCLSSGTAAELGTWRGLIRARPAFSAEQYFLGNSCDAVANIAEPSSYPAPVSVTYFVTATAAD